MAARIAARLDVGLCSSCIALNFDEDSKSLVMERLAYGGVAVQKVICAARPAMASIPPRTFEKAVPDEGRQGQIRELPAPAPSAAKILERKVKERAAKDISEARAVVCVGRGIDKKEDLALARQLADVLGGEIGCTRPIAEEFHWLPEEVCIGLSGIQVKPDIYLGIGVSGQVQHVTGIRNARVIAAVNKDENAPIFKVADFGIIGDLYDVVLLRPGCIDHSGRVDPGLDRFHVVRKSRRNSGREQVRPLGQRPVSGRALADERR
jgi:electron transfer flavoprotein alpha subunit